MFQQQVRTTVLENGITVMSDNMPSALSATVGAWIPRGSRHETLEENGLSHLYEHLVFKGTEHRTAKQIACAIEDRGGILEAYTTRQDTGFYAQVVREDIPLALEVIADLLMNPRFDPEELEKERKVIIEEVRSYDDIPEEIAGDTFNKIHFQGCGLAMPIAGSVHSVKSLTLAQLWKNENQVLHEIPLLVCAAGNVDHDRLVDDCRKFFEKKTAGNVVLPIDFKSTSSMKAVSKKETQQTNVIMGSSFLRKDLPNEFRFAFSLFNVALGSGMASRLFQKIREEHGLAYTIYSNTDVFLDCFDLEICFATDPKRTEKTMHLVHHEIMGFLKFGFVKDELKRTRANILGGIRVGADSTEKRALRLAEQTLHYGYHTPIAEVEAGINNLNEADIIEMMRVAISTSPWSVAAVMPEHSPKVDFSPWMKF